MSSISLWLRRLRYMSIFNPRQWMLLMFLSLLFAMLYLSSRQSLNEESDFVIDQQIISNYEVSANDVEHHSMDILMPQSNADHRFVAAVLVMCSSRHAALSNHMSQLLELRPSKLAFPVVISQDGNKQDVQELARSYAKDNNITYIQHPRPSTTSRDRSRFYKYIAQHYKWALNRVFNEFEYDYVIITEDDLEISPDFFSYFSWAKELMQKDSTIWCASAWNDNGIPSLIDTKDPALVWRTDFFPGLGWMLSRKLWKELEPNFPDVYWDDWLRNDEVRKNRSCLRPEVPRTSHNMLLAGKGSSGGMYKSFLSKIKRNMNAVDFSLIPTDEFIKESFDVDLVKRVREAKKIFPDDLEREEFEWKTDNSYSIEFSNIRQWMSIATIVGFMSDIRGGIPRTAYSGIVTVRHRGCRLYIYPKELDLNDIQSFTYHPEWDKMMRFLEFEKTFCRPGSKRGWYKGKCDPNSEDMKQWFVKKRMTRQQKSWGTDMIII